MKIYHPPLNPLPSRQRETPSPLAGEGWGEGKLPFLKNMKSIFLY